MASFEFLAITISILGLAASITYYASILRNANKTQQLQLETRQAQIFMDIYNTWRSPSFRESLINMNSREWKDFQDWQSKYRPIDNPEEGTAEHTVLTFYDGVGLLVRRRLIDVGMVDELLASSFIRIWEKFGDVIYQVRISNNNPRIYQNAEYLYNELMKLR